MRFRNTPKPFGNSMKGADAAGAGAGAAVAGVAAGMLPPGVDGTNNFQFTKMGAGIAAINPIAGVAATAIGLGADLWTGAAQNKQRKKAIIDNGQLLQDQMEADSVYAQEGGYNQDLVQFRRGGNAMRRYAQGGNNIIPNNSMQRAGGQFQRAGVTPTVIGGQGGPTEDNQRMMTPNGPIAVSSGEGAEHDDVLNKVARSMGIGFAEYQRSLYPDAEGSNIRQYARGGPQNPPSDRASDSTFARQQVMDPRLRMIMSGPYANNMDTPGGAAGYRAGVEALNQNPMQLTNDQVVKLAFQGIVPRGSTKVDAGRIRSLNPKAVDQDENGTWTPGHYSNVSDIMEQGNQDLLRYARGGPGGPVNPLLREQPPMIPQEDYFKHTERPDMSVSAVMSASPNELEVMGDRWSRSFDPVRSYNDPTPIIPRSIAAPAGSPISVPTPTLNPVNPDDTADALMKSLQDKMNDETKPNTMMNQEELQLNRLNRTARNINLAGSAGSFVYNLLSKRTPGMAPRKLEHKPLDLDTNALKNMLANETKSNMKTAQYSFRGRQNLGAELGIVAAGANQKMTNAMQVEQVQNTERQYNNAGENRVRQYNNDAFNQFAQNEVNANNQFRAMKGQILTNNLSAMGQSYGNYVDGQIQLSQMGKQARLWDSYEAFRSGESNDVMSDDDYVYDIRGYRKRRRNERKAANA